MATPRSRRAYLRFIKRRKLAARFYEWGSLYGTDDRREVARIKAACRRAGIPMGKPRLDRPPEVLDPAELAPLFRILFTGTNHW